MSTSVRTEHNRPASKPLARMCLQSPPPAHVHQIDQSLSLFSIDLPADVGVIGFVYSDNDYWFTWYPSQGERDDALTELATLHAFGPVGPENLKATA